jgi:hypothetical protein
MQSRSSRYVDVSMGIPGLESLVAKVKGEKADPSGVVVVGLNGEKRASLARLGVNLGREVEGSFPFSIWLRGVAPFVSGSSQSSRVESRYVRSREMYDSRG